ncbi:MAG: uridine diphosphate-N-acetylglucosamine-binding protein YvcK [Candidatus Limnocylindrus sp.]
MGLRSRLWYALRARRTHGDGRRVVVLGGGTGMATALSGLKREGVLLTAIVSLADDGGSSGILREQLGIPPVGDLRNCLIALADAESTAGALLQHRLPAERGATRGHPVGNLLLAAAIAEEEGDLERGIERVHRILHVRGRVIPATSEALRLRGRTRGGVSVVGQAAIARTRGIASVSLDAGSIRATASALDAIEEADLLVLGPGSLYTSLIPHLLVPEIRDALAHRRVPLIWVANVDEQEGETEGMDLDAHLDALEEHGAADLIDLVLASSVAKRGSGDVGVPIQPHFTKSVSARGASRPPIEVRAIASRLRPHLHDPVLLAQALLRPRPFLKVARL